MTYWILSFTHLGCFMGATVVESVNDPDASKVATALGLQPGLYEAKIYEMPAPRRRVPTERLGTMLPTHASVSAIEQEFWAP